MKLDQKSLIFVFVVLLILITIYYNLIRTKNNILLLVIVVSIFMYYKKFTNGRIEKFYKEQYKNYKNKNKQIDGFTSDSNYVSVLGAGVDYATFLANNTNSAITPFNLFAGSTLDRGFDNLTGTFDKCLCLNNGGNPSVLLVNFGDTGVKIEKVRIWARSDFRNEMVKKMVVEGSFDNSSWMTLFDNRATPFNTGGDYPITTDGMVPSEN